MGQWGKEKKRVPDSWQTVADAKDESARRRKLKSASKARQLVLVLCVDDRREHEKEECQEMGGRVGIKYGERR